MVNSNHYGLVSRSQRSFKLSTETELCLDTEPRDQLNILKKLIKIKTYMSWNDTQRIQSGLTTTQSNTGEILHYFPLMKGRKVIAFVLFSGTEINMEYVIILERIMTYIGVAYQLQSKQEDLA